MLTKIKQNLEQKLDEKNDKKMIELTRMYKKRSFINHMKIQKRQC